MRMTLRRTGVCWPTGRWGRAGARRPDGAGLCGAGHRDHPPSALNGSSAAAIIANLHDVVIILGFFAFFQWEFSLSVLAGVLAVLGYSVNGVGGDF